MSATSRKTEPGTRSVACIHCEKPVDVGKRAMSVFCPHCRKRLIVEDYKITGYTATRELFTSGNLVIEKRGHVSASVKANNITVRGKMQGKVTARGCARIDKTGWFKGDLEAPRLSVHAGAVLDAYLRIGQAQPAVPVHAE